MNFSSLSQFLNICNKKIYRWYYDVLSQFKSKEIQEDLHKYDLIYKKEKISVPILKEENFGQNMCIDEKNMGDQIYTLISNKDSGKIAVMASTTKTGALENILSNLSVKTVFNVKTLSKDLAAGYEDLRKRCFLNSTGIADKFHVVQMGVRSLVDIRSFYRNEEKSKLRELRELHISNEAAKRDSAEKHKTKYIPNRFSSLSKQSNGETSLEILSRSSRALTQFQVKWGKSMRERMKILFKLFPHIKKVYRLISAFRGIYNRTHFGKNVYNQAKTSLHKWYQSVGGTDIPEIQNFASSVKHHEHQILAYFLEGHTNAFAESLNANIQRFINRNFGIRNRNFFHFRIKKLFS